jgi:hypothetical protein
MAGKKKKPRRAGASVSIQGDGFDAADSAACEAGAHRRGREDGDERDDDTVGLL